MHQLIALQNSFVLNEHVTAVDSHLRCVVDFTGLPHTEYACSDSGEKELHFNRKNFLQNLTQDDWLSVITNWGFEMFHFLHKLVSELVLFKDCSDLVSFTV